MALLKVAIAMKGRVVRIMSEPERLMNATFARLAH